MCTFVFRHYYIGSSCVSVPTSCLSCCKVNNQIDLPSISQILFGGASAGGIGMLSNIDHVAKIVKPAKVLGYNDGGWFTLYRNFLEPRGNGAPEFLNTLRYVRTIILNYSCYIMYYFNYIFTHFYFYLFSYLDIIGMVSWTSHAVHRCLNLPRAFMVK